MQIPPTFVSKNHLSNKLEIVRKDRQMTLIDALLSVKINKWKFSHELHLGAYFAICLSFGKIKYTKEPDCIINPLLEFPTLDYAAADEEFFINYNR